MSKELNIITEQILLTTGIDVSIYDDSFLMKLVDKRMSSTRLNSIIEYCDYLIQNKDEASSLVKLLSVNYSMFFRNSLTFAYLEQVILPALIERKLAANETEIRIWSAACASGQEAYSIAILCDEIIEKSKTKIGYRVFATDMNENEIANAKKGLYQSSELNSVTLKRIQNHFSVKDAIHTIIPRLKEYVDFSVFDLLSDKNGCPAASVYGSFDIVLCSNLLFYYKPEYQKRILQKVEGCLLPNGYLITSETEREIVKTNNYNELSFNSAVFQKN